MIIGASSAMTTPGIPARPSMAAADAVNLMKSRRLITTPALGRETMERVLNLIRKDVAEDKVRVDTPTQNLESYFLQVVQHARDAAAQTSGAMSGARVAAYLRGEAEGKPATDKILERLSAPQAAAVPAAELVPAETVDQRKLEALTQAAAPATQPKVPSAPEAAPALEQANEKLAGLIKKGK